MRRTTTFRFWILPTIASVFASAMAFSIDARIAYAQHTVPPSPTVLWPDGTRDPDRAIVSVNIDDDNDDGVPDAASVSQIAPASDDDLVAVEVLAPRGGRLHVSTGGPVRVWSPAGSTTEQWATVGTDGRATIRLHAVEPSVTADDGFLEIRLEHAVVRTKITAVHVVFLRGDNQPVWAHRSAVRISHAVTNDLSLPRVARWDDPSTDPENVRVQVWDPGIAQTVGALPQATVRVSSQVAGYEFAAPAIALRAEIDGLAWSPGNRFNPLRTGWLRLVADETDSHAPGVAGQVLRTGLRDRIQVEYRRAGTAGAARTTVRVGRPGNEQNADAARIGRMNLVVMTTSNNVPVVGDDVAHATMLAREQVRIANEIYAQCGITFGNPDVQRVRFVNASTASMLSFGDDDGLRASGGRVQFTAGTLFVGPVAIERNDSPLDAALRVADRLRAARMRPVVTVNARPDYAAGNSADLMVYDAAGVLVPLTVSTDWNTERLMSIKLGVVDMTDGIDEFNNLNSTSGTLEERTMIRAFSDQDPRSIDLFFVNYFSHHTRIGEAFVEGSGGSLVNTVLIDRNGAASQREAWTQSHESGHVLLDQPWHPDNLGPDQPSLLMDSDASQPTVLGPKRLLPQDCARIRDRSGPTVHPPLLSAYDPAVPSLHAAEFAHWPERPLYPLPASDTRVEATSPPADPSRPRITLENIGLE